MPCPRYSIKSSNSHHSTPKEEVNRNALLEDLFSKLLYCQCLARKSSSSSWRKMSMFSHFFFSWMCVDEAPPSLSPKPIVGERCWPQVVVFQQPGSIPLGRGRKGPLGWQGPGIPESKCPPKCLWQVPGSSLFHFSQSGRCQERNLDLLSNPWASNIFVKNKYLHWTFLSGSHKQGPAGHNLFIPQTVQALCWASIHA